MKLCKDCKHFDGRGSCTRWHYIEPVNGETSTPWIIARVERIGHAPTPGCTTPDPCGPEGKYWVEAPPPPPPAPPWWRRVLRLLNAKVDPAPTRDSRWLAGFFYSALLGLTACGLGAAFWATSNPKNASSFYVYVAGVAACSVACHSAMLCESKFRAKRQR